jgi:hypothetical protein
MKKATKLASGICDKGETEFQPGSICFAENQ